MNFPGTGCVSLESQDSRDDAEYSPDIHEVSVTDFPSELKMFVPTISDSVRNEIMLRASLAFSDSEVKEAIFDGLVAAGIDWRSVPLDEIKSILVDAVLASRGWPCAECV